MAPSQRPQSPNGPSAVASNFAAALDSIFDTNDSLFSLSVGLQQKQESISTQSKELEALEAQLKDTETRLKKAKRQSLINQSSPTTAGASSSSSSSSPPGQELPIRSYDTPARAPISIPHKISEASLSSQYSSHQQTNRPMTAMSNKSQRTVASQRA